MEWLSKVYLTSVVIMPYFPAIDQPIAEISDCYLTVLKWWPSAI